MAESSFAWLSVVVKRGALTVFARKIIKIGWGSNFGELLTAADPTFAENSVNKVCISSNDSFRDPVHEVDITAPLSLCSTFNCLFVCFYLDLNDVVAASTVTGKSFFFSCHPPG